MGQKKFVKGPFPRPNGGWQLFSPTLLVEVNKSLLIRWVACTCKYVDDRRNGETLARVRLPHLVGPDVAW
jgi:hypothetical protein